MVEQKLELVQFLKERSIFKVLDERVLEGIVPLFQEVHCGPGHIVFKQGDEAEAIYVIREGSVEVLQEDTPPRVIAYLTSGDCFGEMALLHDTVRSATIRVPEEAVILRLSRKAFSELQSYFPEITREVTRVINRRLSGKLPFSSPGLQGNLAFFDLPTVIQTVAGSRQTGVIVLRGRAGKLLAQIYVRQGRLTHASFMHLTGEAALYELLTRNEPLDFAFEKQTDLDPSLPVDKELTRHEPYKLLMEGARRADELPGLAARLDWPDCVFRPVQRTPDWSALTAEWMPVARKLWFLLDAGLTLKQLAEKLPYDRYTVLSAVEQLLNLKMVRVRTGQTGEVKRPRHDPIAVASMVSALNAVLANLAVILGEEPIRAVLTKALEESKKEYANLASLRIHPETGTLDVRAAKPDVSQSEASVESLGHLTLTLLKLAAQATSASRSLK